MKSSSIIQTDSNTNDMCACQRRGGRVQGVAQVVECLLSEHKGLNSGEREREKKTWTYKEGHVKIVGEVEVLQ
jgi:hypothetical protein